MPARAAQRQRRVAAAVEEQQRLLARSIAILLSSASRGEMNRPRAGGSRLRSIASISGMCGPPCRDGSFTRW